MKFNTKKIQRNRLSPQLKVTACLLLLANISGCSTLANNNKAEPSKDIETVTHTPKQWSATFAGTSQTPQYWLKDFNHSELTTLVKRALTYNHDLSATRSRVDAARARSTISKTSRLPIADIGTDISRSRRSGSTASNFNIGSSVSWEADVWGRLANDVRATSIDAQAVEADYRSARLSLAASVVRNVLNVIENKMQLRLAQRTRNSFQKTLETIEDRYRSGLNSSLDVRLARTNVATASNTLAARKRELDASIRTVEILLGDYPKASLATAKTLPSINPSIPAGLPTQLLARRPDIIAAEYRLNATGERLESAKKNRLPSIQLTGNAGTASSQLKDLLDWDNLVWSLLGSVTQPLLQGKRLGAEETLARAQHKEKWSNYAQTVLTAFNEVETALAADAHFIAQENALRLATKEATLAVELATDRYTSGLENITTLLESQRRMFNAESALLQTQLARLDNRVKLYLALGGDFYHQDKPVSALSSKPLASSTTSKGKSE